MCYSPEVDLIAGLAVGAVGIEAIRHVDDRRNLALAAVPVVLAAHLLVEAVAWWGLEGSVSPAAGDLAVSVYLIIALGVVPVLVPYAVMRSEPDRQRQARMFPFVLLGIGVSIVLLFGMATNPHGATIGGRYLAYHTVDPAYGLTAGFYVIAVCTPFLMSSQRRLVVFGVANIVALTLLSVLLSSGLISLWCFWAAVSSVVIARHIRETSTNRQSESSGILAADRPHHP
ncbi:MAG: DUF6629 family protein [Acidimicrobiia bacterium]